MNKARSEYLAVEIVVVKIARRECNVLNQMANLWTIHDVRRQ